MQMEVHDLITARVEYCEFNKEERHSQLYQSRLYYKFQSAMQDVIDGSVELFENVPDELLPKDFAHPVITYGGVDSKTNRPTDFEFRYYLDETHKKQLIVWVGTVIIEDERIK